MMERERERESGKREREKKRDREKERINEQARDWNWSHVLNMANQAFFNIVNIGVKIRNALCQ